LIKNGHSGLSNFVPIEDKSTPLIANCVGNGPKRCWKRL